MNNLMQRVYRLRHGLRRAVLCSGLLVAASSTVVSTGALAQETTGPDGQTLRVGVVDVSRVVKESPQASRAKSSMAIQFARRKNELEAKAHKLGQDVDRLAQDGSVMSDSDRDALQSDIRDSQRELQVQRSKYNDDVADAERKELDSMRTDILEVIDQYARNNGYDLILGDGVIYVGDGVDVTDDILAELEDD